MSGPHRILLLADQEDKAVLLAHVLGQGGGEPVAERIRSVQDLARARASGPWDAAVVEDGFSGMDALEILGLIRAGDVDLPVIVVSPGAGEERLLALFLAGAAEHLSWEEIAHLPQVIRREIHARKDRPDSSPAEGIPFEAGGLFKAVFEFAPDGLYVSDLEGNFVEGNRAAERLTGYGREELLGRNFLKLKVLSPKDVFRAAKLLARNASKRPTGPDEFTLIRKDGSTVEVEVGAFPVEADGRSLVVGIIRDVTDRRKAQVELRESRELYRLFLRNANDCVYVHEINREGPGRFLEASEQATRVLGYSREELLSLAVSEIDVPEQRGKFPQIVEALFKTGHAFFETEHLAKDGSRIPVEVSARMFTHQGRPMVLSIVRDVRERKSSERERAEALERLRVSMRGIIQVVAQTIEMRDPYTAGHQRRSADLARAIATEMGLSPEVIDGIRVTGQIHDVGKIAIPAEILSKPTKLMPLEYDLVKTHAQVGYEILKGVEFPWPVAETILQHHERLDGSGYPRRLKGEDILLEAKILMVADVVEAMMTHRPFRPAYGVEAALKEVSMFRGRHYEPVVVDACVRLFREKNFKFRD
jgi:PAS domain S-box-containing protein